MDQKRFLAFIVLSMAILIGWNAILMPLLFPPQKPPAGQNQAQQADEQRPDIKDEGKDPDNVPDQGEKKVAEVGPGPKEDGEKPEKPEKPEPKPEAPKRPKFEHKTVELGSTDSKSPFRQLVTLNSRGSSVQSVELNDPRYRQLQKPNPQLLVVGHDGVIPRSLETEIPQLGGGARHDDWELVDVQPPKPPHQAATFRLRTDKLEVLKKYELGEVNPQKPEDEAPAYELKVELSFRNLDKKPQTVNYELQGPTGIPLENDENTQKYRDVVVGFDEGDGSVRSAIYAAKEIADGKLEQWTTPLKYIGVDCQYFAAMLLPGEDQTKTPFAKVATQQLIGLPLGPKSEISVLLTSVDLDLAPAKDPNGKDQVKHAYHLFSGPKRDDLLPPGTAKVIDFGMFHWISRPMLYLLKSFYAVFGSWGIAVMCLTVVVRGAMFPVSIKQARGAAKMQELQPELQALKEKYKSDKEKFARAQMELFSKHNYNPLAGCLPIFLQLPVFMGLYQALNHAVDLRMAPFLYISNLAAPDALFRLPFSLPFLGQDFNLLPIITVMLFLAQQKLLMPPPTNEEMALQQKMMNFMTVFMGFMFYKVPAGLCVYFIASSLWGLAERKLLPKAKPAAAPPASGGGAGPGSGPDLNDRRKPPPNDNGDKPDGFFVRLMKAAEKETAARREANEKRK